MSIFSIIKRNTARRILAPLLAMLICLSSANAVFAVNDLSEADSVEESKSEDKIKEEENPVRKDGGEPLLGAGETGILVDSASGRVLFEKSSGERMYPASTTKIMTALLAIEAVERGELSMDTQIEITPEMLENLDIDGTSISLVEGEILTLENLLRGLMIASGNDAASAIATYVGKSVASFVDMMNARATELGAENTHFVNPHGLHEDDHYTTAADMAKIACAAMKHFEFRNIVDIAHVKIPPTNKTEKERYYINTNGLLSTMRYTDLFYKGSIGIKTGYTSNAGNCLVSAATRSGVELIGVVFGGKTSADSHRDSAEMLDWGFENHISIVALNKNAMPCEIKVKQGKGTDTLTLAVTEAVNVTVPKETKAEELEIRPNIPEKIYAPISQGDKIGTVSVLLDGEVLGTGELIATQDVERTIFWPVLALGEWLWSKTLVRVICYAGIIFAAGFVILFVIGIYRNIKRAKRRRRRRR
ncbi:MAG: D-alanyl-D-alanine carboxypeptidase [Clostridia bacterium]|nr:D-alanyl-D-alanine carboxypeptidase [Clostridia bacterium]